MLSGKRRALYELVLAGVAPIEAVSQVYPLASNPMSVWDTALQEDEFAGFRDAPLPPPPPPEVHPALVPGVTKEAVIDRLWSIALDPDAPASAQVAAAKELSNLKGYSQAATENFRPNIIISIPVGYTVPEDHAFKDFVTIDVEDATPKGELSSGDAECPSV